MNKQQRVLFLYLNTGNGHITPARILAQNIQKRYGDTVEPILLNGFSSKQYFLKTLFERGYHFTNTFVRGAYSLFYDINTIPFVLRLTTLSTLVQTVPFLTKYIQENGITKIVCLHFALCPAAASAIRKCTGKIPLIIVVTDPFTAHPSWFLIKRAQYIVFSNDLKEQAVSKGIQDVTVFPFVLKPDFNGISSISAAAALQQNRKTFRVLVIGGGEGLPGMVKLIRYILQKESCRSEPLLSLTAVCGKNVVAYTRLSRISRKYRTEQLNILGYVHNIPELMQNADCIISKAGASTVFEILSCCKPVIFCTYIHGQELGNVRYAVQNGAGWFIQKPADIYQKLCFLAEHPAECRRASQAAASLRIHSDLDHITRFIIDA